MDTIIIITAASKFERNSAPYNNSFRAGPFIVTSGKSRGRVRVCFAHCSRECSIV